MAPQAGLEPATRGLTVMLQG